VPLVFALFGGTDLLARRCVPHGALQDLVLRKPVKVPPWLERGLERAALHLPRVPGVVVRRDRQRLHHLPRTIPSSPIVPAEWPDSTMVLSGAALLLLGAVVGRPYCRLPRPTARSLEAGRRWWRSGGCG
jgi:hypothetical protein